MTTPNCTPFKKDRNENSNPSLRQAKARDSPFEETQEGFLFEEIVKLV